MKNPVFSVPFTGNNALSRLSWTGTLLVSNLFDILDLLAHLFNQQFEFNRRVGGGESVGF